MTVSSGASSSSTMNAVVASTRRAWRARSSIGCGRRVMGDRALVVPFARKAVSTSRGLRAIGRKLWLSCSGISRLCVPQRALACALSRSQPARQNPALTNSSTMKPNQTASPAATSYATTP